LQALASTEPTRQQPLHAAHPEHRKAVATIDGWSVVGHDRIAGTLLDRPGGRRRKKIITSPIVRVRWTEGAPVAVVHTRSGSVYLLAKPAEGFGAKRAARFLRVKSAAGEAVAPLHDTTTGTELTDLND